MCLYTSGVSFHFRPYWTEGILVRLYLTSTLITHTIFLQNTNPFLWPHNLSSLPSSKTPLSPSGENSYGITELCGDVTLAAVTGMAAVQSHPWRSSLPVVVSAVQLVLWFCSMATTVHIKGCPGLVKTGRTPIFERQVIASAIRESQKESWPFKCTKWVLTVEFFSLLFGWT